MYTGLDYAPTEKLPPHWAIRDGIFYRRDGVSVRLSAIEQRRDNHSHATEMYAGWEIRIPHHYGQPEKESFEIRWASVNVFLPLKVIQHVDKNCPMLHWGDREGRPPWAP